MHAAAFICAAWQVHGIPELLKLGRDVQACWACWSTAMFWVVLRSFYRWGINSLRSEGSPPGPEVSSRCGKEMVERCVLFVRTGRRCCGLLVLSHEAVFAVVPKDLCAWLGFCFVLRLFLFGCGFLGGWGWGLFIFRGVFMFFPENFCALEFMLEWSTS